MRHIVLFAARIIRPVCALLALSVAYPATAQVVTINFDGTFGTPTAGFPFQDIARFEGSFTYDDLAPPTSQSGSIYFFPLLSTRFTFYNAAGNGIFSAAYAYPNAEMRTFNGNSGLNLFLGPGITGPTDPSDFRLFWQVPLFTASAIKPLPSDLTAAVFSQGFAEAGVAPNYENAPVTSARLFTTTTLPEPGTVLLSGMGMAGLLIQRRRVKKGIVRRPCIHEA